MADLIRTDNVIAPMSRAAINKVRLLEAAAADQPQVPITTEHMFHAGMYARSIKLPAGVMITGALIKIATLLIIIGDVIMYVDGEPRQLSGYNVLAASACRKQVFIALTDVHMTMLFPTDATTVQAAEDAFTDEVDLLASRRDPSSNVMAG